MWFTLLRKACATGGMPESVVRWWLRPEVGEIGGRFHYHFLLTDFPVKDPRGTFKGFPFGGKRGDYWSDAGCMSLMHVWQGEVVGGWAG